MYSIEWQKGKLPQAHILVWLINKITPDQTDQIISAEIPLIRLRHQKYDQWPMWRIQQQFTMHVCWEMHETIPKIFKAHIN